MLFESFRFFKLSKRELNVYPIILVTSRLEHEREIFYGDSAGLLRNN